MRSPNPSNGLNATVTIKNDTNTDLYVNMNQGHPTAPNGVVPKNSTVTWTSTVDSDNAQLLWKDRDHPNGASGQLAFSIGGGVAVSPGGDSWVTVAGFVDCNGGRENFSQQGPGPQVPWNSQCRSGTYNIFLNFTGTLVPPKAYACNLTVVNNATGTLYVQSSNAASATLTKGMTQKIPLIDVATFAMKFNAGTKGWAVGSLDIGNTVGVSVARGDMTTIPNPIVMTVVACSESAGTTVTYTQSANVGDQTLPHQMFTSDQFKLGGCVTVTYSDATSTSSNLGMC